MDDLGDIFRVLGPVDHDYPLREDTRELAVGAVDLRGEPRALALDPVGLAFLAPGSLLRRNRDEERAVGQETARRQEVQLEHPLDAQPPGQSLVGERRVQVAIGDHIGSACERRADHLVDELRACSREEGGLRPGRHALAVEEDSTDLLAQLCASGLACENDVAAR
jgi:hypothetical protein